MYYYSRRNHVTPKLVSRELSIVNPNADIAYVTRANSDGLFTLITLSSNGHEEAVVYLYTSPKVAVLQVKYGDVCIPETFFAA